MTKLGKILAPVINRGTINGAEYPIRDIGRSWDLEKMASGEAFAVHGGGVSNGWWFRRRSRTGYRGGWDGIRLRQAYGATGPNGTNGTYMTRLLNKKTHSSQPHWGIGG